MHGRASHGVIGVSGWLSYLLSRLCGAVPGLDYIRHLVVAVPAAQIPPMPRGYGARALPAAELAGHCIDACPRVQAERFGAGMTCIGAFDAKERLVGVTWIGRAIHDEPVLQVRFRLPRHAAWDGGLWIDEDRRMSRAFVAVWAGVGQWLEQEGLGLTISSIADYNAASLAAHRRLGAQALARVSVLRIGSMQLTLGAGARPRWSRPKRRPEIDLQVDRRSGAVRLSRIANSKQAP